MAIAVNKKVREKASTAERIPLESAVNMPDAKMLIPEKRKLREKSQKPSSAIGKTGDPSGVKILTIPLESRSESRKITSEEPAMKEMQMR